MARLKSTEQHGQPVAPETLRSAVAQFVAAFVRADKRERTTMLLLTRPRDRIATLQGLPRCLLSNVATEVRDGLDALALRLGDVPGIVIDHESTRVTTLRASADSNQWGALFIAADGSVALIFAEIGEPLLCKTTRR